LHAVGAGVGSALASYMKTNILKKSKITGAFNAQAFLDSAGVSRTIVEFQKKDAIFSQGDVCKNLMYIQKGSVKLSIVSKTGKEAVVAMLKAGDFVEEGGLAGQLVRIATATATAPTTLLVIGLEEMRRVLHAEHALARQFFHEEI
jgi:CRP/FNR family cyclic AMP-dependent transcriptional regulator